MSHGNLEADKMLDVYIYHYLLKRNLQNTAKCFMAEGKVAADPLAIDAPGGFLFEWWSVFWDIFIARANEKHSEVAAAYIEAQQIKAREQQMQMQYLQQRHAQLQRNPSLSGPINTMNFDGILGASTASALAAKIFEERLKPPHPMDSEPSQQQLDPNRIALLKSATNHTGQLVQGNSETVSAALQQIQTRTQQSNGILQAKSPGLGGAGLNQGVGLPLKGWPLTGIDQLRPNLGPPNLAQNQFQLLTPQQQQRYLAQAQAHGGLGNLPSYGDMDPRRFRGLPTAGLNGKDGQSSAFGSPMQSTSPKVRPDQAEYLMKLKAQQMQQSSAQQSQEQLHQQLQQNNRKRKQATSSGAANSTGTGNTVGLNNSPPSTPSTHTPGDGVNMAGSFQHVNNMSKGLMMYGADGTGHASSSNQMDDLDHFGDVASLDDNVESFLSHDDGDPRDIFAALKRSPTEHTTDTPNGITFNEVGCIRTSNSKVVCCHFSSDGKLLASAGHEKKVVLWNMDTLQTESSQEEHALIVTDVRFRPNTTKLATSSFDRTVKLWDAADPGYCLSSYSGHTSQVRSLDFHPKKTEVFCSCDGNGEIRLWNVTQQSSTQVLKGGMAQVRFQPWIGLLLAAAMENVVSVFDVETDKKVHLLQGHTKDVHSICWDTNGEYVASVSHDSVKVWSLTSGDCIHELSSNGNNFHSCVFHPSYSSLLVIGGYQSLEVWNMVANQTMTVAVHEGMIVALAQSPLTGMVASASHDKSVKLWK